MCYGNDVEVSAAPTRSRCLSLLGKSAVKSSRDLDNRKGHLLESLRLFEETAASLTMENLRDTLIEYWSWNYYPGSVQLTLTVSSESEKVMKLWDLWLMERFRR